jgi:hypothetical protein
MLRVHYKDFFLHLQTFDLLILFLQRKATELPYNQFSSLRVRETKVKGREIQITLVKKN